MTSEYHLLNPNVWPCSYTQHTIQAEIQGILFDKKPDFLEWNALEFSDENTVFWSK
jgi:hypothetical protein